ncbi:MAG: TIGR00282 family metallophosphoesterase [Nitrospiraceae bacterium]|nr:TIGR00282 family metallophosphoesterase [Nitrospiraceae bacterium]
MKILFIGDIVGRTGRSAVKALLPKIREKNKPDFVIANGENAAGGFGINEETARELFSLGIDVITGGNHIWDKKDIIPLITKQDRLLRPLNFPPGVPGRGSVVVPLPGGISVAVLNLQGRVFMTPIDCPFRAAEEEIKRLKEQTSIIVVDFHAEATSEKVAMGWFLDGKATAVIGTHTHVQTADEKVLPGGTAYITDAGMTGPADSVIGVKKEQIIDKFLHQMPVRFELPGPPAILCGLLIEADEKTGFASSAMRLQLTYP